MRITARAALLLATGVLFLAGLVLARPQGGDAQVLTIPVRGPVSMLEGRGGNVGVCAGPDGVWIIDTQFADMAPKLQAAVRELSKEPLRFVINTHWHGDHTGGNESFGALAPLVAHARVRGRMAQGRAGQAPAPAGALPSVTFEDGLRMYANGEDIEVRHVGPAHTDGDSIVWFHTSNAVHLGDLFFNGRFPFVDLDSGGSVRGLTAAVADLLALLPEDVRIVPGHGPLAGKAELREYHAMLVDCQALVAAAHAQKKDAATMKQEKLLARYARWNWEFIDEGKFIDTLAREAAQR